MTRGTRLLDAGCGAGRFAEVALSLGARVIAVDFSNAIDAARENLKEAVALILEANRQLAQRELAGKDVIRIFVTEALIMGVLGTLSGLLIASVLVNLMGRVYIGGSYVFHGEYESFVDDEMRTGVIEVLNDIRWDVRPSPAYGTVEVRICDGVSTIRELAGLCALMQCLVVDLDQRLDSGETLPTMPPWHVQENKWRSARYGLDAEIILDAAGSERLVTEDLDDLLDRLTPVARKLECEDELASVAEIPSRGASYQRQRKVAADTGQDLVAVVDSVVRELEL